METSHRRALRGDRRFCLLEHTPTTPNSVYAFSRAIRANGSFDVEAFAKVEVTSWQGYCLGAGIGSKAAATNLSKRGVNWVFKLFFHQIGKDT